MKNSNEMQAAFLHPPVISIVGKPDCGKTTLLQKLIPALREKGYHVGIIKHHVHEFDMDRPGKDTWKLKQAGADIVALSSPTGLGVIRNTDKDTPITVLVRRYFQDMDVVLTEGYKQEAMPKIEIYRSSLHETPLTRDQTWAAMVSDRQVHPDLPHFLPDSVDDIAQFIIKTFINADQKSAVTLVADGNQVELSGFVTGFLQKSIMGMVSSLKGCEKVKEITITIHND